MSNTGTTGLDRRTLLRRGLLGGAGVVAAGAAGGGVGVAAASGARSERTRRTLVVEVACLLDSTFTMIPAEVEGGFDPSTNARGSTFYVEGDLYPAGTIPDGADEDDPFDVTAAEPTGHWICRGWFINTADGTGAAPARPEPHVITHQEYLLGRMSEERLFVPDQLTSSGTEGSSGEAGGSPVRSVIGGTGAYAGMTGQVTQRTIGAPGANTDGGPNFRFEFDLRPH